jgi:hypothetical protein
VGHPKKTNENNRGRGTSTRFEGNTMKALSRQEWIGLWSEIDPKTAGETMSFPDYCELVNKVKARWMKDIPAMSPASASNERYVAHLEDVLERGGVIDADDLSSVSPRELRFDAWCFPNLLNALRWTRESVREAIP